MYRMCRPEGCQVRCSGVLREAGERRDTPDLPRSQHLPHSAVKHQARYCNKDLNNTPEELTTQFYSMLTVYTLSQ